MDLEQEFDVEDKFELTKEQINELRREFDVMLESCGFIDFVQEIR